MAKAKQQTVEKIPSELKISKEEAEARVKQLSDQLEKTQKKANGAESKELKDAVKQAEKMLKQAQKMLK